MDTIILSIDGRNVETKEGRTVLEAALEGGIYIPHLCHHPDLRPAGACRLCITEIEGREGLPTSCTTLAAQGMVVKTKTPRIDLMRLLAMELMLARHPADCTVCSQYLNCELQSVKQYIGTSEELSVRRRPKAFPLNTRNPLFVQDFNKCILCGRCVRACHDLRGVAVLSFIKKGSETCIGTVFDQLLTDAGCRFCGACVEVCPTGALRDKEELMKGKSRRAARVPCKYTCPAEIDIPRYIRFIREKNYSAAAAVVREKAPFPRVLGYVCSHPCETGCRRGEVNEAISIRELKRFAAERDDDKTWRKTSHKASPTDKRVAVVGSGPAGLTAAYYLSKLGHGVTVFEALPSPGGMMRVGIPKYRLPEEILNIEIKEIERLGVDIKTNTRVNSLDTLFQEGYNAISVAVGTHRGQKLPIPGADLEGVLIGTNFLRDVNLGREVRVGRSVLVLGGGSVAFDCARVARRLSEGEVHLACLEPREAMLAAPDEIEDAEDEGVVIHPSHAAARILSDHGHITGVECLDVQSFEFDEDRRVQIDTMEGSEHILPADTVIFAIGQHPEVPSQFGLTTGNGNLIEANPDTFTTSREGIFAAGDAVTGTSSVIQAIASGRKVAVAVDQYLGGDGMIDEELAPIEEPAVRLGCEENFACQHRRENSHTAAELRLTGFSEIVHTFDEEAALQESRRCLQCDLRLKITPVRFWGDY